MTPLVVIRHGPTAWTAEGRIQGRSDVPLSPEGRDAVRAWRLPGGLRGAGWVWLCSPLSRARETAALLKRDGEVREDPALIEMNWGAWEGRVLAELRQEGGPGMAEAEARGLDFRPPGGESPRDLQARLAPLLDSLARTGAPCVAVTHKGVIRGLYARAEGWDLTGRAPVKLRDACAHRFLLDAAGRPRVDRLNLDLTS